MIVLMIMITVLFVTYVLALLTAEKAKSKLDSMMYDYWAKVNDVLDDYLNGGNKE